MRTFIKSNLFFYPIIVLVMSVMAVSCDKSDKGGSDPGSNLIEFRTQLEAQTLSRSTVDNTWNGGELVQVCINEGDTVVYVAEATSKLTPQVPLYWSGTDATLAVRAWHPETFAMNADQSTAANYQGADFIFAKENISYTERNTKPLKFYHKTAKVVINLIKGDGIDDLSGVSVSLAGYTSATVTPADGTITGSGENSYITPLKDAGTYTYKALMIPQNMTGKEFVKVSLGDFTYFYLPAASEAVLTGGRAFVYNMTVSKDNLKVEFMSEIVDWSGSTYDVNAKYYPDDYLSYVPDAAFKTYLLEQFDSNGDDKLSYSELENIVHIQCNDRDIYSVQGIEHFYNLQRLHCQNNNLTSLNVSNNQYLMYIDCSNNNLTSLDVRGPMQVIELNCSNNNLTELILNEGGGLTLLNCSDNELTSLNLPESNYMQTLMCNNNKIAELDLSKCYFLYTLHCKGNLLTSLDISVVSDIRVLVCDGYTPPFIVWVAPTFQVENPWVNLDSSSSFGLSIFQRKEEF